MRAIARVLILSLGIAAATVRAEAGVKEGLEALDRRAFEDAARLFREALDKGEADAAFYLGRMMELGLGAPANMERAIGMYRLAAERNSPLAKNRLGLLHLEGIAVLQDYETGAKLVCEAAKAGNANGLFNCAIVTMEGRGVAKDPARAVAMLRKAAAQDHIGAKNLLAQAYLNGTGVKEDRTKAIALFRETAEAGNPVGLFSVAQAYTLGLGGLKKDLVRAHAYFNLAAVRGHPEAAKAREMIEAQLAPEQVAHAQRIAREWKARPASPIRPAIDRIKSNLKAKARRPALPKKK